MTLSRRLSVGAVLSAAVVWACDLSSPGVAGSDASVAPPDASSGGDAGDGGPALQDAGRTDARPELVFGEAGAFFPPTMLAVGFDCEVDGKRLRQGQIVDVDDCVVCQCSTWGFRCRKNPSCQRDVCVFVDGTTVSSGGSAVVAKCFDCRCVGGEPSCARRIDGDCPEEGCYVPPDLLPFGTELPVGTNQMVSECHRCTCDANAGLSCENLCHPTCDCFPLEDGGIGFCGRACGKGGCLTLPEGGLTVPDQECVFAGSCATMLCDYGELHRDESRCP